MKQYHPLLQQVLDETAAERQRITDQSRIQREHAELKELSNELLSELEDIIRLTETSDVWLPISWKDAAKAAIKKADDQLSKIK